MRQAGIGVASGLAMIAVGGPAKADGLDLLKAELEALRGRLGQIEQQQGTAALPAGYGVLSFQRGQAGNAHWDDGVVRDRVNRSAERGFTIVATPVADLPVPAAEVTVYGYVKGDVIYSFQDNSFGPSTSWSDIFTSDGSDHFTLQAKQSRFGIKSSINTSLGPVRTKVEGDFEGAPYGRNDAFRLRHAYGEWDFAPDWTLLVGKTWHMAGLLGIGVDLVDFGGNGGFDFNRDTQVRLRYGNGPLSVQFGIEEPLDKTDSNVPTFSGLVRYKASGGHLLMASASVGQDKNPSQNTSFTVQAGANLNLFDRAMLTGAVVWGEGSMAGRYLGAPYDFTAGDRANGALGVMAGVSVPLTSSVTFNAVWDYLVALDDQALAVDLNNNGVADAVMHDKLHTLRANVFWRPVSQLQMGWEASYFWADDKGTIDARDEYAQLQFATWFFF